MACEQSFSACTEVVYLQRSANADRSSVVLTQSTTFGVTDIYFLACYYKAGPQATVMSLPCCHAAPIQIPDCLKARPPCDVVRQLSNLHPVRSQRVETGAETGPPQAVGWYLFVSSSQVCEVLQGVEVEKLSKGKAHLSDGKDLECNVIM